jgi:hypothetical protein
VFYPEAKPYISFWNHGLNPRGRQHGAVMMLGEVLLSQKKAFEGVEVS